MLYKYDNEYKTLQQWDDDGTLRACMSMPEEDLWKLSILNFNVNINKLLDLKEKLDL